MRRHHVAETSRSNISARNKFVLLSECLPRAGVRTSTHVLAPRTLVTRATDTACATPAHEAEKGDSKGVRRVFSSRFFFAFCGNRDFLCILHSKRVSRLCSARRTRALRRLKADLLGKHPNKQSSLELASSALGARHSPRKDTDTQAPYGNPYQLCVPSKRYPKHTLPSKRYQKHTFPKKIESSYQLLRSGPRATDTTRKLL